MYEKGIVKSYKSTDKGTYLQVFVPNLSAEYIVNKEIGDCGLWFDDGRHISCEQRKKIYATLQDIGNFTGYTLDEIKEIMKLRFQEKFGIDNFSLSSCSIADAGQFIDFLMDFCFAEDIPLSDLGLNRTSHVSNYLYMCLKHKKCCVCGRSGADEHHEDAIGMGNDRTQVDDSKKRKISLCREHHTEAHMIGRYQFQEKYHVYGIVYNEDICFENYKPVSEFFNWNVFVAS